MTAKDGFFEYRGVSVGPFESYGLQQCDAHLGGAKIGHVYVKRGWLVVTAYDDSGPQVFEHERAVSDESFSWADYDQPLRQGIDDLLLYLWSGERAR